MSHVVNRGSLLDANSSKLCDIDGDVTIKSLLYEVLC